MSLYSEYMKEREGIETIENEHGFLTYKALPDKEHPQEYRIFDLFVMPDFRQSGVAAEMADEVRSLALKNGCKILTGSVDTRANGATVSVKVLLAYGFKILRTEGSMIYFVKTLKEERQSWAV